MNKETVKKILMNQNLDQKEFFEFITDYVKKELNEDITKEQLFAISQLVQQGIFNIQYAAEKIAFDLQMNVMRVINKQGIVIKTIVD